MITAYDMTLIKTLRTMIKARGINFTTAMLVEAAEDTGHTEEASALDAFVLRRSDMTPHSW